MTQKTKGMSSRIFLLISVTFLKIGFFRNELLHGDQNIFKSGLYDIHRFTDRIVIMNFLNLERFDYYR